MLAQSFISAAELGITEPQRDALQKVLVLLETGRLTHMPRDSLRSYWNEHVEFSGGFNMSVIIAVHDYGTAGCIIGTAEMLDPGCDIRIDCARNNGLFNLAIGSGKPDGMGLDDITPAQAARALRSYLTTGDAKWAEAVA